MKQQFWIVSVITAALVLVMGSAFASDQVQIYGSQLMTKQERLEYRERLRNAATDEEREQIQKEHQEEIRERAKAKGVTLPEEPAVEGRGLGIGSGNCPGGGMGKGRGMGHGGGSSQ